MTTNVVMSHSHCLWISFYSFIAGCVLLTDDDTVKYLKKYYTALAGDTSRLKIPGTIKHELINNNIIYQDCLIE